MKRLQQRITQKSYFLMLILLAALSPWSYKHCWHIPYRHAAVIHSTVCLLPLSLTAMGICCDWLLKTSCVLLWQDCWMAAPCEAFNLSELNLFCKRLFLASVIPLCAQSDRKKQETVRAISVTLFAWITYISGIIITLSLKDTESVVEAVR